MIPARMGSQRLKQKNRRELAGIPLITRAIRNCQAAGVFDAIWVNSEHPACGEIAAAEGVGFHKRPQALANNQATSEDRARPADRRGAVGVGGRCLKRLHCAAHTASRLHAV